MPSNKLKFIPFFATCALLILPAHSSATEPAEPGARLDSTTVQYHLPEIVVTATRLRTRLDESSAAVTVIHEPELAMRPGLRLASTLTTLPGVFVRPYGGGGALQTVSFRGMGSEHTLLIVDNQRVNNLQNGQADFGMLSRLGIERVEVVRGGHSALYGADAIGGVVRAFTKRPSRDLSLHASVGIGSAGLLSREVGISGSVIGLGVLVSLRSEKGDGKYPYRYTDGTQIVEYERLGADHSMVEALARLTWRVSPELDMEVAYGGVDADRGVPGPVIRPDDAGGARLSDQNSRVSWLGSWEASKGLTARLTASMDALRQNYTDPSVGTGTQDGITSTSDLKVYRVSPEIEHAFGRSYEAVFGLELQDARIIATSIGERERYQWSLWYSAHVSLALGDAVLNEVSLYPSLRYDRFSDFGEAWSPKVGVSLTPLRTLPVKFRASYGGSFRAPTFNELFWVPGGNPSLLPERSTSFDAGVMVAVHLVGDLRLDAGIFSGETKNRILWLPGAGAIWSPKNVGRVTTRGIELEAEWVGLDELLGLSMNSTWTDARKASSAALDDPTVGNQLVYVPPQTVNVAVEVHASPIDLRLQHSWVSFRYTTESNDHVLPSYGVASASARIAIPLGASILNVIGEIDNIFGEAYEVIPQYPMPVRAFSVSLGVDL